MFCIICGKPSPCEEHTFRGAVPAAYGPRPHKVMTPEEYISMPIVGWHEVCRDIDGAGNVGIRFHGN